MPLTEQDFATEYQRDIIQDNSLVEIDITNYALLSQGGVATASSQYSSSFPANATNDGDRTHKKWGGVSVGGINQYGGWQSAGYATEYLIYTFAVPRSINRFEIFFYPNTTKVNNTGVSEGASAFNIYYQLNGDAEWLLWTGLSQAREQSGGLSISGGQVTSNTRTHVALHDSTGLTNVKKIKVEFTSPRTEATTYKVLEVEIYRSLDITAYVNSISVNRRKDIYFNRYVMAQLDLTLQNTDKRFSPYYIPTGTEILNGFFNYDIRTDMRIRTYLGYEREGASILYPTGHFYVSSWKPQTKTNLVRVVAKDRVKYLSTQNVDVESAVISGKTVEYLLEYMALQSNISTDEISIDETLSETQYFFPEANSKIWKEMQNVAESVADIALFVNKNGILEYRSYLQSIPHEWSQTTSTEFESGSLDNVSTRNNISDAMSIPKKISESLFSNYESITNCGNDGYGLTIGYSNTKVESQEAYSGYVTLEYPRYASQKIKSSQTGHITKVSFKTGGWGITGITLRAGITIGTTVYYSEKSFGGSSLPGLRTLTFEFPRIAVSTNTDYYISLQQWTPGRTLEVYYKSANPYNPGPLYSMYVNEQARSTDDMWFQVYMGQDTAEYISGEIDTGCLSGVYDFSTMVASVLDTWSSVTIQIGSYSSAGTAWAAIPALQKQTITTGATPTIANNRFLKFRIAFDMTGKAGTPYVYSYSQSFALTGTYVSQTKDTGGNPSEWGIVSIDAELQGGSTVSIQTQVSTDGITWDAAVDVGLDYSIKSALKRYIRVLLHLSTLDGVNVPLIRSLTVYYETGSGSSRTISSVGFEYRYNGALKELSQSLSDEYSGQNELYTKVTVKTSPYFLQSTSRVWEANVPFTITALSNSVFNCEFSEPCETNSNMKLYINGLTFTGGTQVQGNMTVTFTKSPRVVTVTIVPSVETTITSMYIDAQTYQKTGSLLSIEQASSDEIAKYGLRDHVYENEYIYVKTTADLIAKALLNQYRILRAIIDGLTVSYTPNVDIGTIIRIVDDMSGIDGYYEVIGYTHTVTSKEATTKLQAAEVNITYGGPMYYGGSDGGYYSEFYWGGRRYG